MSVFAEHAKVMILEILPLQSAAIAKEPISLESPVGDKDKSQLGDFIQDADTVVPVDAAIKSNLKKSPAL